MLPRPPRLLLLAALAATAAGLAALGALAPFEARPGAACAALLASGLGWLGALALAFGRRSPAGGTLAVVLGALFLRAVAFAAHPALSDDVWRYVWEGGLVAEGRSPYAHAPDAPELAGERLRWSAVHARLNHPETSAAYPPLTQAACAAVVTLAGGPARDGGRAAATALRAAFTLADLLVLLPLFAILRARGLPPIRAVAWGWCPLVAVEFAGSAHFDALGILCLVGALRYLPSGAPRRARPLAASALLGAGAAVKLLPACALPFALRDGGRPRSGALAFAAVLGLALLAPAALEGGLRGLGAGLGAYGLTWQSFSLTFAPVQALADRLFERDLGVLDARRVARAVVLALWACVALRAWRRGDSAWRASFALVGAFLVLTPTLHPWYVTWIVPFLAVQPSWAWRVLVALVPLAYWPLAAWRNDGVWREPAWLWPLVALPFLALAAAEFALGRGAAAGEERA